MFSLKIQNFEPRKLAKYLAVNVEKRIQFTGRCTMKVSEREISRQMKVRKTAVPNTIKKISKNKYFQGQQKTGRLSIFSSGNKRFISSKAQYLLLISCAVCLKVSAKRKRSIKFYAKVRRLGTVRQSFLSTMMESSRLASLLLRWKAADAVLAVLSFNFYFWRYEDIVVMS